jgi:hypothetical protein
MYKIIGADQKEYGPVTSDQIRQWIADARVNAQTQARAEGTEEWKPLSAFAEFADRLGVGTPVGAPPPLTAQNDGRAAALRRVKAPAVALTVTAVLNLILSLWDLVKTVIFPQNLQQYNSVLQQLNNPQLQESFQKLLHLMTSRPLSIAGDLFGLAMTVLILMGALKMQSLRSYEFSITAAILSMVPCVTPCCLIGLPFGIWALIVLRMPEVKSQFH